MDGSTPEGSTPNVPTPRAGYQGDFDLELMGEDIDGRDYRALLEGAQRVFNQWVAVS